MFDKTIPTLPKSIRLEVAPALEGFNDVIKKSANKTEALQLMHTLNLDKPFLNRRSSAEQFETAYDAMNKPVTGKFEPANTSLIPMREAIETALDQLLNQRPNKTNIPDVENQNKDWRKINAIAEQLKQDSIPDSQISYWAGEWTTLKKNLLSPAKTERIDRDEWAKRINRSTIFLIGFLSGLDSTKLR
jgi:hypothetical protein